MHIINTIKNLIKRKPVLFTTPGHSQGDFVTENFKKVFGRNVFQGDFSEVEGMDNLQKPCGVIFKSLKRTSEIYGSKTSFYLVNGSSSGIIVLILSTVKRGEKILISRNAHKSVINALILSGAMPVWVETEWNERWEIPGVAKTQKIAERLKQNPDIKALLITNPTYEGVVTDLEPISKICQEQNIVFLVDEAHGALWNFSEQLPTSSLNLGADACVQSLHKTGSCLNQGALLHLSKNSKIDPERLQEVFNIINTTSPSYLLLSSIESSIEYLNSKNGRNKLNYLLANIENMKESLKTKTDIEFLEGNDPTKIFFGLKNVNGQVFSDFLENKFNIEVELNNNKGLLALTGIGTCRSKLKILENSITSAAQKLTETAPESDFTHFISPKVVMSPSEAFYSNYRTLELSKAIGLASKETITIYPPGIPLVIAGEMIQQEHLNALKDKYMIKVVSN